MASDGTVLIPWDLAPKAAFPVIDPQGPEQDRKLSWVANGAVGGKLNCVNEVGIELGDIPGGFTHFTVFDEKVSPFSAILLDPRSDDAQGLNVSEAGKGYFNLTVTSVSGGESISYAQTRNDDTTTNINANTAFTELDLTGVTDFLDAEFEISGFGIKCLNAGVVKATASVKYSGAVQRANCPIKIMLNGSVIDGEGASGYVRNASGHLEASVHITRYVTVAADDIISAACRREAAAGTITMTDGQSLLIVEQEIASAGGGGFTDDVVLKYAVIG